MSAAPAAIADAGATGADASFMAAALGLARRGMGLCAPNPAVGALVVRDGIVVGRGWTKPGGRPHAETEALIEAGGAAVGATLYVTLEPCSHHGHTPPCAEAVIGAGISHVVCAMEDPDARVAGRGLAMLRAAGLFVTMGVLEAQARRANLGHVLRVTRRRPMITLKLAETADGYAAGARHDFRLAITGALANGHVHMMRAQHDAIMVGRGTQAADDPLMTVRLPGMETRKPLRVVLDTQAAVSLHSRLVATARDVPSLVIAGEGARADAVARLEGAGIEVVCVARAADGHVDLDAALAALAARGITRIFSEGGPTIAARLIARGLADEVVMLTAPKPLGRDGVPALEADARLALTDAARFAAAEDCRVGIDRMRRYERVL